MTGPLVDDEDDELANDAPPGPPSKSMTVEEIVVDKIDHRPAAPISGTLSFNCATSLYVSSFFRGVS